MNRSAGILMPVFSLPSPYGIGSLGADARAFVEFLQQAGQGWWQVLPLTPPGAGNSPYSSESTFAGNLLFIDLDTLAQQGLLTAAELAEARMPQGEQIDYTALRKTREPLLRKAFGRMDEALRQQVRLFGEQNLWVQEYALYKALKTRFGELPWYDWPDAALRSHEPAAVKQWQETLRDEMEFHICLQFWFFTQWAALKEYANQRGVRLMGDLPIYVSLDSADVWCERHQFLLDGEGRPTKVAGVPPDYFSEEGQLWGNPLYDWDAMAADGYGWWIRRMDGAVRLFDAVRIDHFRAFERYWAVPAAAKTAREGEWEQGPGIAVLKVLKDWFSCAGVEYIAEDLGTLTEEVHALRREAGLPGMKVLQFAFDGPANAYLPHNHERCCVCYTGTHDNNTLLGWYETAEPEERAFAERYLGACGAEAVRQAMLRCGQASVADLFVAQMQDYLALDGTRRINVPGVAEGNWGWRMLPGAATDALAAEIRALTETYGRSTTA